MLTRGSNSAAKSLTFFSVILLLAVFRHVHVSRIVSFTDSPEGDRTLVQSGSRRSLVLRTNSQADAMVHCWEHVSLQPPEVSEDRGAMGDIKKTLADWAHISSYVQSCEFQSQHSSKKLGAKSQGVVIPSAGHAMFAHTWVVVTIMRDTLGCNLPIEVIYNGQEELDVAIAERLQVITMMHSPGINSA